MIYIGIDPGLDGALAFIEPPLCVRVWDIPTLQVGTKREIDAAQLAGHIRFAADAGPVHVVIESVHSMPEQGVASSFSFGKGFGMLIGICAALSVPYSLVPPQRWKKALMDGMAKEKDSSRQRAIQLFPQASDDLKLKKHHGRADALLMAEYGRRLDMGQKGAA